MKKIGGFKPPSGNWVMGLGSEAYVEEPKKLRDRVKADMKKSLVQYEGIKPALMENRSHSASE